MLRRPSSARAGHRSLNVLGAVAAKDLQRTEGDHCRGVRSTGASAGGRTVVAAAAGELVQRSWERARSLGALHPESRRASRFGHLGRGSLIGFPSTALFGERWMLHRRRDADRSMGHAHRRLRARPTRRRPTVRSSSVTVVSSARAAASSPTPASTSATTCGWARTCSSPMRTTATRIRRSRSARQIADADPVTIGSGSWLGHGAIVLPGAHDRASCRRRRRVRSCEATVPDYCVVAGIAGARSCAVATTMGSGGGSSASSPAPRGSVGPRPSPSLSG